MIIRNNVSVKHLNSFGIDQVVERLIEIQDESDLHYLDLNEDYLVLGGGSNILLTKKVNRPLVLMRNLGREILIEKEDSVLVKIGAGEIWHEVVMWAVNERFGGIENLALIPGRSGAAPMQNIGAYGVEIKDVLHTVYAFDKASGTRVAFHNSECDFAYRMSNFKTIWKDRYVITQIVLSLTKPGYHKINTSYGAIKSELEKKGIDTPNIKHVADTVVDIRKAKLPDPQVIGNAGSFFKNPIIDAEQYNELSTRYPDIVAYPSGQQYKLAAGWLIDQCGWRGYASDKQTGTYKNQALVIVNYGKAKGQDILTFSQEVQKSVKEKFGVSLEPEVNIW